MTLTTIKLTSEHTNQVSELFGSDMLGRHNYGIFCSYYLTNLEKFHGWGTFNDNKLISAIGYYDSIDDAAGYLTHQCGEFKYIGVTLDSVAAQLEAVGKYKIYSRLYSDDVSVWDECLSDSFKSRYITVTEYTVRTKEPCIYTFPWHVLYMRTLWSRDTVVKCSFLKEEYREKVYGSVTLD